jgi:hypothetical protein
MKIFKKIVIDISSGKVLESESYDYNGPVALCIRDITGQAGTQANTATSTGSGYNSVAQGIGSNLVPQLTRQMNNPQGFSQRDQTAQLSNAVAGAGGATAGLTGAASKEGAVTRNPMGFASALDAAARSRDKAAAGAGERVASNNATLKAKQMEDAQKGLGEMYGTAGKLGAENTEQANADLLTKLKANTQGWQQNWQQLNKDIGGSIDNFQAIA